jgi:hypothetical protein
MPEAIAHFAEEAAEKVHTNQSCIMVWDDIKDNPPRELKISPITAIPHKSRAFCSILDLSFWLKLKIGGCWHPSMTQWRNWGLLVVKIHAFAEADKMAKIFIAKWDIKDGFWCLDCM